MKSPRHNWMEKAYFPIDLPLGQCCRITLQGGDHMGYHVKWVEEHLGVTRKALRIYEEKGLMPKNVGRQYRSYDEEDIDRIWTIKVFQGMGYSLSEIVDLVSAVNCEDFDFQESISQKVISLEAKRAEAERLLGYAKMIQLTGRFPSRPKEMGNVTFDTFHENSLAGWNVHNDPRAESALTLVEQLLEQPKDSWGESELGRMLQALLDFGMNKAAMEATLGLDILQKAIIARSEQGADSVEVQLLVKLLHEQVQELAGEDSMSPQHFGRLYSSSVMEGQIGRLSQQKYGADGCAFLADAIAVFGGYKNYEDSM